MRRRKCSPLAVVASVFVAFLAGFFLEKSQRVAFSGAVAGTTSASNPSVWQRRLAALGVLGAPSHWRPSHAPHFLAIAALHRRAINNTIILVFGNAGSMPFLLNLVCHLSRLNMTNYVLLTSGAAVTDLRTHPSLHGQPSDAVQDAFLWMPDIMQHTHESFAEFNRGGFRELMAAKFTAVEMVLQLGLTVVLQDADVMPRHDYRPYLWERGCGMSLPGLEAFHPDENAEILPEKSTAAMSTNASSLSKAAVAAALCTQPDFTWAATRGLAHALDDAPSFLIQRDTTGDADSGSLNTGFFLARPSAWALFAVGHTVARLLVGDAQNEQEAWGQLMSATFVPHRVKRLPFDLFPSGHKWASSNTLQNSIIVHPNWVRGLGPKMQRIQEAGLLAWSDEMHRCAQPL